MSSRRAFTMLDSMFVLIILLLAYALVAPLTHVSAYSSNRSVCGARTNGIYTAIYTYSVSNDDWFPTAGTIDLLRNAQGFRGDAIGEPATIAPDHPAMVNNITASLFMLVRDGSVGTKSWICPKSAGTKQENGLAGWDFTSSDHLTYSVINMYHVAAGKQWNANVNPEFALLSDDNNATGPDVHTPLPADASQDQIRRDNSRNHGRDGQNMLYGDGHTEFNIDPFNGPNDDNIFAMTKAGRDAPPTLGLTDGDAAVDLALADQDVVMIPKTGNNGVSLSSNPPMIKQAELTASQVVTWIALAGIGLLIGALLIRNAIQGSKERKSSTT